MTLDDLLAAAASKLGDHAGGVLARVGAGVRVTADRGARARAIAAWRAPIPGGLRAIHASWIEAALATLPPRARDVLAGAPANELEVWLARAACADFPPMPPLGRAQPPRTVTDALALPDPLAWLASVGLDQLAFALTSAGATSDALARLGEPVRRAASRILLPPRAGQLGSARAAVTRSRVPDDDHRFARIGARALAPHLSDDLDRRRLALRLPRPLGLVVLDELRARAPDPLAAAPTWAALSAPIG